MSSPYLSLVPRSYEQAVEANQRQHAFDNSVRIENAAKAILDKAKADLLALGIELNRTTGFEVPDLAGLIDGHIHDLMSDSFGWARGEMSE